MFDSLSGLRSVLQEFNSINGNLNGTNTTGYKANNMYYGGTGSQSNGALQTPDTALVTSHTELNFQQGQIQNTGELTDFAINGNGFFLLQQVQDVGVNPPNLLSRDGNFRFLDVPALGGQVMGTANGLIVLTDDGLGNYVPLTKNDFMTNGFRPAIVKPDNGQESLAYSNKGSTVFEFKGTFSKDSGLLVESALEASNSNMHESLTAMSLAQKKFAAMATQIKIEQANLDIVTQLIK